MKLAVVPLFLLSATATADAVLSTLFQHAMPAPAELTVRQGIGPTGAPRYESVEEDTVTLNAEAYGSCNLNFRLQAATITSCNTEYDGSVGTLEVCPSASSQPPLPSFSQPFDVDTGNQTFGPRDVTIELPTEVIEASLVEEGGRLLGEMAESMGVSPGVLRSQDFEAGLSTGLTFRLTCRRWAFGNATGTQTSHAFFPLRVTYRGASEDGTPPLEEPTDPDEGPDPGRLPIPIGELTDRVRIEQARLLIVPEPVDGVCGFRLSLSARTSGPTTLVYRLVDDHGALSPEHQLEVGPAGAAFAAHPVTFSQDSTAPDGFTTATSDTDPVPGPSFGGALADLPGSTLRGFYQAVFSAPHAARSNVASFNIDDCSAGPTVAEPAFSAVIVADPTTIREELFGATTDGEERYPDDAAEAAGNVAQEPEEPEDPAR